MSDVLTLRPLSAAMRMLSEYGASLPEAVEEARALHHRLRQSKPATPDRYAIGALALDKSPRDAAKALAEAKVAEEVYLASIEVASSRAVAALRDHSDEVATSVLTSPRLRRAVADLAAVAPTVDPTTPHSPAEGAPEDQTIGAAQIRKAERVLTDAATALDATLGAYFDPSRVALLWLAPDEVTDWHALDRALRGVRFGVTSIPVMVTHPGSPVGVPDQSANGLRSAVAATLPGVTFRLAESLDEYEERVAAHERGLSGQGQPAPDRQDRSRVTVH